jgi:hypothetical protein
MHSGTDSVEIALWNEGTLMRAIGVDGVRGVVEDVGDPLPWELPFWAGQHPHEPEKFIVNAGPSPFPTPFHPLDLGDAAVQALFGFIVEGRSSPDDIDPWSVHLHGFRVTDPDRPNMAEQHTLPQQTSTERTLIAYRMEIAPDGRILTLLDEVDLTKYFQ